MIWHGLCPFLCSHDNRQKSLLRKSNALKSVSDASTAKVVTLTLTN
jgi:hypothetical protein